MNSLEVKTTTPKVYYTKMPSVLVWLLAESPVALMIYQYVLIRKGRAKGWKFHVNDIAKMLKKDDRTIRENLKPLIELGLITLKGEVGKRFYEFNAAKYQSLLKINPFESLRDDADPLPSNETRPLPLNGRSPLPINETRPLPLNGSVDIKGTDTKETEMKETETGAAKSSRHTVVLEEVNQRDIAARKLAAKLNSLKPTANAVDNDPGLRDKDKTLIDTVSHQSSSLTVPESETSMAHFNEVFGTPPRFIS